MWEDFFISYKIDVIPFLENNFPKKRVIARESATTARPHRYAKRFGQVFQDPGDPGPSAGWRTGMITEQRIS